MNVRWASRIPLLVTIFLALASSQARGQGPMGYGGPTPAGPMPMHPGPPMGIPPSAMMPGPGAYPPASPAYSPGQSFMSPPGGGDSMMGGGMGSMDMGPQGGSTGAANCNSCGGLGCPNCASGPGFGDGSDHWMRNGLCGDLFGWLLPYPDGGCGAPRWYDVSLEYMYLQREDTGRDIVFTQTGPPGFGVPVLSTGDLDFDPSHSFRFSAMLQAGAGSNWEFTYFGLHFFDAQASVIDPTNDLFSIVSGFGTLPFGGFDETDGSGFQSLSYNSDFDNFELNFRQRWSAPNCRYQGSWLAGVRYFKLDENFTLFTEAPNPIAGPPPTVSATFLTDVNNSLTGAQVGGDVWICIVPGVKIGAEGKAGIYGNHTNVDNIITTNTGGAFAEEIVRNDVAFIGEGNLQALYRLSQQWTVKLGYTFLYVDGVALAPENFNATPPALFNGPLTRTATANSDGTVFYHGATAGVEFLW